MSPIEPTLKEYEKLRDEILSADRTCITIIGALLAFSGTVAGITSSEKLPFLLPILQIAWIMGFIYISDKRFSIQRIAIYTKTHWEGKKLKDGLYWETWLRERIFKDFNNWSKIMSVYKVETFVVIIASVIITFTSYFINDSGCIKMPDCLSKYLCLLFRLSLALMVILFGLIIFYWTKYNRLRKIGNKIKIDIETAKSP